MMNRWLKRMLTLAVIGCTAFPVLAQEPQKVDCPCTEDMPAKLNSALQNMRLSDGLLCELEQCKAEDWSGWSTRAKEDAFRFMVLFHHFKSGDADLVRRSVEQLLDVNPNYDSSPDPLFFQNIVDQEKETRLREKRRSRRNLIIGSGGGALIGGVVAYLLLRPRPPRSLPLPLLPGSN